MFFTHICKATLANKIKFTAGRELITLASFSNVVNNLYFRQKIRSHNGQDSAANAIEINGNFHTDCRILTGQALKSKFSCWKDAQCSGLATEQIEMERNSHPVLGSSNYLGLEGGSRFAVNSGKKGAEQVFCKKK